MNWYLKVIRNYFVFSGRARRMEFWMFVLINAIIGWGLEFIDFFIGTTFPFYYEQVGILSSIYSLAVLIPNLAVTVRRLHDTGHSGWMLLLMFLPIVGWIWILVLLVQGGNQFENRYGADPKLENEPAV